MYLIGSGDQNAVFGLLPSFFEEYPHNKNDETESTGRPLQLKHSVRHAGRVGRAPPNECIACLEGLRRYTGVHEELALSRFQRELLLHQLQVTNEKVLPYKSELIDCIKEGMTMFLLPNFTINPLKHCSNDNPVWNNRAEAAEFGDVVIELKPKSSWRPPQIVGIAIGGGEPIYIHPSKLQCCRFSQMQCWKREREGRCYANPRTTPYCPTLLFHSDQSTLEGIRRLREYPSNNLRVLHHRRANIEPELALSQEPLDSTLLCDMDCEIVAEALDRSELFSVLERLQLYGVDDTVSVFPVLDIELLYAWSLASPSELVEWIVVDEDGEVGRTLCQCIAAQDSHREVLHEPFKVPQCKTKRVRQSFSLEECIRRFYVATTARDVSVIISVSESEVNVTENSIPPCDNAGCFVVVTRPSSRSELTRPSSWVCHIGVVDLDDKQVKSLKWYADRDAKCVEAWSRCHSL